MTGLQDGRYLLHVRTDGGKTMQLIEPYPEADEVVQLRKDLALYRAKSGVNALSAMSIALRHGFGMPPQAARLLAFLFINSPRPVGKDELLQVIYGHRADGGPDWSSQAVGVLIHRVRIYVGGKEALPYEAGAYWLTEAGAKKCRDVVEKDDGGNQASP